MKFKLNFPILIFLGSYLSDSNLTIMYRLLITLFSLLFLTFISHSQDFNPKWGKVSKEELQLDLCTFDSTANAMVLSKTGFLTFNYSNDKGWQYEIDVVKRIKIFNTDGKSEANVSLKVYDPITGSSREEITSLKGFTYNLDGNKIDKTKLENDMIFETRLNDYRSETSFAMPNVKEGSVIEFRFSLRSDYISNLYEWHIQEDIPVSYINYAFTIPEFFTYNHSFVGNVVSIEKDKRKKNESFTYKYMHNEPGAAPTQRQGTISSVSEYQEIVCRGIPALRNEPMMNNKSNQISRIESQLVGIQMPGKGYESVATTYDDFSKSILKWSTFGGHLERGGFAKDQISSLASSSPEEKVKSLYSWIQNDVTFTNVYGFSSNNANKKLIQSGEGSVADINLTLIAVLKEAGLQAYPIILSTRGNGLPHPVYPNYEEFNYVIAGIIIDQKLILADAASSLPIGVLPTRCLNGKGWMVKESGSQWVDLKTGNLEKYTVQTDIIMAEDEISKSTQVKFDDYALYTESGKYQDDKEEYRQSIANTFNEVDPEINIEDEGGLRINIKSSQNFDADIIYLSPFEYGVISENPFKRNERFSNVDFPFGTDIKVISNLEIPEGYSIEMPENTAIGLPDNGGRFIYSTQRMGNRVTVLSQFELSKTVFSADEYPILKQFYQLMADKNTEPIVLKKL